MIIKYFSLLFFLLINIDNSYANNDDNFYNKIDQTYNVYVEGLNLGELKGSIRKIDDHYNIKLKIETKGLLKVIKFDISAYSNFLYKDNIITPLSYYSDSLDSKTERKIELKFNKNKLISETITPPDNRLKRPAVDDKLKNNIYDPLTAALFLHNKVILKQEFQNFSINLYEGRRLSKLDFYDIKNTLFQNKKVVHVKFKRYPIQGYTKNELAEYKEGEPEIIVLFDNTSLLPIFTQFESKFGNIIITK